jgi:predicted nucleic acid-binding protein
VIYFDTSALAKKYLKSEKGRSKVLELLESNAQHLVSSALTQLEVVSALSRRQEEIYGFDEAIKAFNNDWEAFIVWTINDEVINDAIGLISLYRLKAADALHLATARSVVRHTKDRLVVVSSDQELLVAANKEGLFVVDPEAV